METTYKVKDYESVIVAKRTVQASESSLKSPTLYFLVSEFDGKGRTIRQANCEPREIPYHIAKLAVKRTSTSNSPTEWPL